MVEPGTSRSRRRRGLPRRLMRRRVRHTPSPPVYLRGVAPGVLCASPFNGKTKMMSFVLLAPTLSTALRVASVCVGALVVLYLCMYCTSCIHLLNCLMFFCELYSHLFRKVYRLLFLDISILIFIFI